MGSTRPRSPRFDSQNKKKDQISEATLKYRFNGVRLLESFTRRNCSLCYSQAFSGGPCFKGILYLRMRCGFTVLFELSGRALAGPPAQAALNSPPPGVRRLYRRR